MGKIIKEKYPELDEEDQEAVRQHAIAALNLTQKATEIALGGGGADDDGDISANTAFVDGVRQLAMDVRDRKSTRLNSSHKCAYRMPSTASTTKLQLHNS